MPENMNLQKAMAILDVHLLGTEDSLGEVNQAWSVVKEKIWAMRSNVDRLMDLINKYESDN